MRLLRASVLLGVSGLASSFRTAAVKGPTSAPKALLAVTPTVADSDAEAFKRITLARRATKHFERRAVPDEVLKKVSSVCPRDLRCMRSVTLWLKTAIESVILAQTKYVVLYLYLIYCRGSCRLEAFISAFVFLLKWHPS